MTGWQWITEAARVLLIFVGFLTLAMLFRFVVYYEHKSRARSIGVRWMMLAFSTLVIVVLMNAFDRLVAGFRANWVSPFALVSMAFCAWALAKIKKSIIEGGDWADATLTGKRP
jgi:hypothetical protein